MEIEFWFEFASPYSYLTVMRIEQVAQNAGVQIIWNPFLLGPIFWGDDRLEDAISWARQNNHA